MAINYRPITPTSYVAFTKATEAIWAKMNPSQRLDNTLYFIVDGAEDTIGKLYLGNTLIADGGGLTSLALSDLSDVVCEIMQAGDILMYDQIDKCWKNVSLADEIGTLIQVFTGATESTNGLAGLVPQPKSADEDFKKYLKGDGTWANPTAEVERGLDELQSQVSTLVGIDTGVSVRTIATDIAEDVATKYFNQILNNAPETLDTLGEIAEWIESHPQMNDVLDVISRVGVLETTVNGLQPQINGLAENITTLSDSLQGLRNSVNDLEDNHDELNALVVKIKASVDQHTEDIADIYSRLVWQEIFEEEE